MVTRNPASANLFFISSSIIFHYLKKKKEREIGRISREDDEKEMAIKKKVMENRRQDIGFMI